MPGLPWCPGTLHRLSLYFVFPRPTQSSLISRSRELRADFGLEPCVSIQLHPPGKFESGGRIFIGASELGGRSAYEIR